MEENDVSLPKGNNQPYSMSAVTEVPLITGCCIAATLTKMVKEFLANDTRCAADCMDMLMDCCTGESSLSVSLYSRQTPIAGSSSKLECLTHESFATYAMKTER